MKNLCLGLLTLFFYGQSQIVNSNPDTEFRGVWIASLYNIDYPSRPTTDPEVMKREWMQIVGDCKSWNMNALIVQVRSSGDALYPSGLVPWSRYLTGASGTAPLNGFDPMDYMVSTAHANGFQFHAWLNPFRGPNDQDMGNLAPNHLFNVHRDWFFHYGKEWLMRPGIPEVRQYFVSVVEEVVRNYDVDAVHFDDYFYPYKIAGESLQDSLEFANYGQAYANIEDWRRSNIDDMMSSVHSTVKNLKPNVQIGVSPFGVWRNKDKDPDGSDTKAGQSCYDVLYADVVKWMQNDWIDYIAPQIYWHIGFKAADYETLLHWWEQHHYNKPLYIGHACHKINHNFAEWAQADQLPRQISMNRNSGEVSGSIFFSYKDLKRNELGWRTTVTDLFYQSPSLLTTTNVVNAPSVLLPQAQSVQVHKGVGQVPVIKVEKVPVLLNADPDSGNKQ
jgi:uncharacterized lipoprotein YddW (UPF0748 family)